MANGMAVVAAAIFMPSLWCAMAFLEGARARIAVRRALAEPDLQLD